MNSDKDRWIKNCHRCLRRKVPKNQQAPLLPIQTSYPLELVCMEFLAFYNSFITNYGIPKRIYNDQGANFDGNIIKK